MIRVEHKRSGFGESLERLGANLDALDEAHDEALSLIEAQNSSHSLDLSHESTVVKKSKDRISIGSKQKGYAKLLTMDGEEVANVYRRKATAD